MAIFRYYTQLLRHWINVIRISKIKIYNWNFYRVTWKFYLTKV